MPHLYGWLDLSESTKPSYALVCRQATGEKDMDIVQRNGIFMTIANQKLFDLLDSTKFSIMKLPYELRHEVLSYVCDRKTMPVFLRGNHAMPPTAVPLPTITRAGDRKLRVEAILVTIKQTTLEIHSGPGNAKLQEWLSSIDLSASGETSLQSGFDAVHALSFPYFSRYPHASLPVNSPNNDIQLMLKCDNLRKLVLTFVPSELVYYDHNSFMRDKPIEMLRRQYRLDSMLSLFKRGELRTVVLRGPGKGRSGYEALTGLAAWFRWEYAIRSSLHKDLSGSSYKTAKALEVIMA